MSKIYLILLVSLLSACTSHMYVAKTTFMDKGQECTTQAYWYKTDYIIGVKADRVLSITAGGQRKSVEFKEDSGKIVYIGDASRDNKVIGGKPDTQQFLCGWAENLIELEQFEGDSLVLYMHCKAKTDSLSSAKGYIPPQEAPYVFTVTEETLTSFGGTLPPPPRPPECINFK